MSGTSSGNRRQAQHAATRALVIAVLAGVLLAGCAGEKRRPDRDPAADAAFLYDRSQASMRANNFTNAVFYLEQLEARFPFSDEAKQAQLDLMYAYFRNKEYESAIDAADNFIRENPTHPRVDYAFYIKGLASFDPGTGLLEKIFRVDVTARPPAGAQDAYSAFAALVERFPNSDYYADARQRMVQLRNRLARYQTHIADYYVRRGAYAGALNRAHRVIELYYGAPSTYDALKIMRRCYVKLGMDDLAADTERLLEENAHLKTKS